MLTPDELHAVTESVRSDHDADAAVLITLHRAPSQSVEFTTATRDIHLHELLNILERLIAKIRAQEEAVKIDFDPPPPFDFNQTN